MEAQWDFQDGQWGRQVAAGGPPGKQESWSDMVWMPVLGSLHVLRTSPNASQPGWVADMGMEAERPRTRQRIFDSEADIASRTLNLLAVLQAELRRRPRRVIG